MKNKIIDESDYKEIELAEKLCTEGKSDEALKIYKDLVNKGCNVYKEIATIYVYGNKPIEQDIETAIYWLKAGVTKNSCFECMGLQGILLVTSNDKNKVLEGIELCKKAEEYLPETSISIAEHYMINDYLKSDRHSLYIYLQKAEKYGYCLAKTYLAKYYFDEKEYIKYLYKRIDSVICVIYAYIMSFVNKEKLQSIYDFQVVPKNQNVPSNDSK